MAEAQTATKTKKTRKPQGPRQAKPVYAIVSYTDEDGNAQRLVKANLKIELERDTAKVMDILESGEGSATILRVTLPEAAKRNTAAPAA